MGVGDEIERLETQAEQVDLSLPNDPLRCVHLGGDRLDDFLRVPVSVELESVASTAHTRSRSTTR